MDSKKWVLIGITIFIVAVLGMTALQLFIKFLSIWFELLGML